MRYQFAFFICAIFLANSAALAGSAKGYGGYYCGDLYGYYQGVDDSEKAYHRRRVSDWIFGYWTGLNTDENNQKELSVWDADALALEVISRCGDKPDARISDIADQLFSELSYMGAGS